MRQSPNFHNSIKLIMVFILLLVTCPPTFRLTAAYKQKPTESREGSGVRLPIHWKVEENVTDVICVKLDVNDSMMKQEYLEVEKHFKESMSYATIIDIKRVQNALLWEHYNL